MPAKLTDSGSKCPVKALRLSAHNSAYHFYEVIRKHCVPSLIKLTGNLKAIRSLKSPLNHACALQVLQIRFSGFVRPLHKKPVTSGQALTTGHFAIFFKK
jgi:hypothetical protein